MPASVSLTTPDRLESDTNQAPGDAVGWTRSRMFATATATYSAYRIAQLLMVRWVRPEGQPAVNVLLTLALLDGALVGASTLVLVAAGSRWPVERPVRLRHTALNVFVAFACAVVSLTVLFLAGRVLAPSHAREGLLVFHLLSITDALFALLTVAAIVQAVLYQSRSRERELDAIRLRAQLTAARLDTLRARLHPHLLFNTLNGISDLIFTDPERADALVLRLAQLLRAALDTVDDQISLREELALTSVYFDIERMRFGDRLQVAIDANPDVYDARVPPFLVQPLAENAILHGIAPRASGGSVSLRATTRPDGEANRLVLEVADDGVGMQASAPEGVGLRITRERLQAMYRDAGALSVRPRPGGGTIATIELPLSRNRG